MGAAAQPDGSTTLSDHYDLIRQLGQGAGGVVWEARERAKGRRVALKVLARMDPASLLRFKREFRAVEGLTHDHLVSLYSLERYAEPEGDVWALVMEFVDGRPFLEWVRGGLPEGEPLSAHADAIERVRSGLAQLVGALNVLHRARIVHRDVKPSNVLVTREGRVVLLDFGVVSARDSVATGRHRLTEDLVGTVAYSAPEQGDSEPGPAADLYSVGVMLFEALTGERPFTGPVYAVLVDKRLQSAPTVHEVAPGAHPDLALLADELLSRDPMARPTSAGITARLGYASEAAPRRATSTFVGREAELDLLVDTWSRAARGEGQISTLILGESGVGKSALAHRFVELLADEAELGALTLSGRCYERESVPYKAFDGIIDDLAGRLREMDPVDCALLLPKASGILLNLFPVLGRVPALERMAWMSPEGHDPFGQSSGEFVIDHRVRAFRALRELLARLARSRPLTLLIDDLHWADADSLALLVELLQPPDPPPVLLLATIRSEPGGGPPPAVADALSALGATCEIRLQGLEGDEARTLARRLLGESPPEILEGLVSESQGHPFFMAELARAAQPPSTTRGAGAATLVRLDDALWQRVEGLQPGAREVLEVLAVAGQRLESALVQAATSLGPDEAQRVVAALRAAHLLRTHGADDLVEPYHDRIREAVLAHLAPARRAQLHGQLANALEAAGGAERQPQALIRHLEAAGRPARAAEMAVAAAERANQALAFERAEAFYRTALFLGEHGPVQRLALRRAHADTLRHAGRGLEAADVFLALADEVPADDRLTCLRVAAEQLLVAGDLERGIEVLDQVLGDFGERLPATPRRALVSLVWQRLTLSLRGGLRWTRRPEAQADPRLLQRIDAFHAAAMGLAVVDHIRGIDFQARALRLALRAGEPVRLSRALALEAVARAAGSQASRVRSRSALALVRALPEVGVEPVVDAWLAMARGVVTYLSFELEASLPLLADAEARFGGLASGSWFELNNIRIFELHALTFLGRWREVRARCEGHRRDARRRGDRLMQVTLARAFNFLWLAADQPDQAMADLEAHPWPRGETFHVQHWYALKAQLDHALYTGAGAEAAQRFAPEMRALDSSLLLRVQVARVTYTWTLGRLLLAEIRAGRDRGPRLARLDKLRRRLRGERWVYASALDACLAAGVAPESERSAALELALQRCEEAGLGLFALAARVQAGDRRAELAMAEQDVADPPRTADLLLPIL